MASGWSVCCSETHSHPTRSTGGRLSSPAILLEDHPTYQAKFLSLVDPSGEVYKFPKIIAVFCLDTTNTLNKIKCPKTFIPPHQCSRWRFCGQMSHPQTMHSLPPFRIFCNMIILQYLAIIFESTRTHTSGLILYSHDSMS